MRGANVPVDAFGYWNKVWAPKSLDHLAGPPNHAKLVKYTAIEYTAIEEVLKRFIP